MPERSKASLDRDDILDELHYVPLCNYGRNPTSKLGERTETENSGGPVFSPTGPIPPQNPKPLGDLCRPDHPMGLTAHFLAVLAAPTHPLETDRCRGIRARGTIVGPGEAPSRGAMPCSIPGRLPCHSQTPESCSPLTGLHLLS